MSGMRGKVVRTVAAWWLAGLAALMLAGCAETIGHERNPTPTPPNHTPTPTPTLLPTVGDVPAIPPEIEQAAAEWPLPGKDYGNTRYTTDSTINASNVNQLGTAWSYSLHGASKWGSAAGAPLIVKGIVYFQDLASNVYAFDLKTGELIWRTLTRQAAFGPNGPGIGWGKVFVQDGGNHLIALDASNGHQLWTTPMFGPAGANQPIPYGGYVYTGVPDGSYSQDPGKAMKLNKQGTSGYTFGFDQATGKMIWSFQTVEEGFWGNPKVNSGAGVWYSPAIDPKTGMTFWATGNPAPMPGIVGYPNASSRPGPNLYSETVLAIDGKTGKLAWYNQVRPHDILNYDLQNSPVLSTAQINGQQKDVVLATGKMGYVYCLDRATGEMYWKTPVGKHENDELQSIPEGTTVMVLPGFWGGVETPAAVADGVVYVATANLPSLYDSTAFGAKDGDEAVANMEGRIEYSSGTGEVVALDINTGKILWDTPLPAIDFGGATVVNDLVFTATYDGVIYAPVASGRQHRVVVPGAGRHHCVAGSGRRLDRMADRVGTRATGIGTAAGSEGRYRAAGGAQRDDADAGGDAVYGASTDKYGDEYLGTDRDGNDNGHCHGNRDAWVGRTAHADANRDADFDADDHRHAGGYGHADDHANANDYGYAGIRAVSDGDTGHQHDADDYGDGNSDSDGGADADAYTDADAGANVKHFGHNGDYSHTQHKRHTDDYRHARYHGDGNNHCHADPATAAAAHDHVEPHRHTGADAAIDAGRLR